MSSAGGLNNQHAWLTVQEAATRLGVQTATIYAYASRGLLGPAAKGPGRRSLYARDAVDRLRRRAAARAGHGAVAAGALRWGEPVLETAITRLSPRGPVYRGRRAIDLVHEPFERVAELLWKRPADWSRLLPRVATRSRRPSLRVVLELITAHADQLTTAPLERAPQLIRRIACAAGTHERSAERAPSIAAALATTFLGARASDQSIQLINALLVLLADHELNASTFAARVAASAGAPWIDCILSALGAAAGVRHLSACDASDALWEDALRARSLERFVDQRSAQGLPGFDAGAYPQGDPRAQRVLDLLLPVMAPRDRTLVERFVALVDAKTGQLPAIDFAATVTTRALGLPRGSAALIFLVGRTAGWLAHIEEQRADGSIRPRAAYVGDDDHVRAS